MPFRIVARLEAAPIQQQPSSPIAAPQQPPSGIAAALQRLTAAREPICRSCEWFQASVSRCARPRDRSFEICYRSPSREHPWLRLAQCPEWSIRTP